MIQLMKKKIAIIIDDVLNNFSEMLNQSGILFDSRIHSVTDPLLKRCLYDYISGQPQKSAFQAMNSAVPEQAAAFLQSLSKHGWEITLCTNRDLRFAFEITKTWRSDNIIPYDYLIQTNDPIEFCQKADIHYLISDRPYSISLNVTVFCCPVQYIQKLWQQHFYNFEDVKKCLIK